jgi:hypothetical protein
MWKIDHRNELRAAVPWCPMKPAIAHIQVLRRPGQSRVGDPHPHWNGGQTLLTSNNWIVHACQYMIIIYIYDIYNIMYTSYIYISDNPPRKNSKETSPLASWLSFSNSSFVFYHLFHCSASMQQFFPWRWFLALLAPSKFLCDHKPLMCRKAARHLLHLVLFMHRFLRLGYTDLQDTVCPNSL